MPIQSPDQAKELARVLKTHGPQGLGQEKYDAAMGQLRQWKFQEDFVDRSPTTSSRSAKDKALSDAIHPGVDVTLGLRRDPDPDSREGVLASEEANGLDTVSGFGDLKTVARAALEFNSPRARVNFIDAAVRDQIDAKGIVLPKGMPVVKLNENLGELQYLRPTEDGKLKWTLANSEVMRPQDIGALADPETLFSAVGAAVGAGRPWSKTAELAGDFIGRTVGTTLEYMLSTGEVTPEEYKAALMGNAGESMLETALSRVTGVAVNKIKNKGAVKPGEGQTAGQIEANVQDAADTLEALKGLTSREFRVSRAEASNSDVALQDQAGKEASLPKKQADREELNRINNLRALDDANTRIMNDVPGAASLDYQPHAVSEDSLTRVRVPAEYRVVGVEDSGFGNIGVNVTPEARRAIDAEDIAEAKFDELVLEGEVDKLVGALPVAQQAADDANTVMKGVIGWSEQRQASKYTVDNPSKTGLQQMIRKVQNRVANALTGAEVSDADRTLAALVTREIDEEGVSFLSGLADESLDVGKLLDARASIARIAMKNGDEDLLRTTELIDNLLKNSTIRTRKGTAVADSTRGRINDSIRRSRRAQQHTEEITAQLNASKIFDKNSNGEYIHTKGKNFETLLASTQFMTHLKPVLDGNPVIRQEAVNRLLEVYRRDVVDKGFSSVKAMNFLTRFKTAIDSVLTPDQAKALRSLELPQGTKGIAAVIQEGAQANADRILRLEMKDNTRGINPKNILGSLNTMGVRKARQLFDDLKRTDPNTARSLEATLARQTRDDLHHQFFDVEKGLGHLRTADNFKKWFHDNKEVLEAVHGKQYVIDMNATLNAHLLDARRSRVRGHAPESQGDVIRVTRTVFGPLSRIQRQITAASYVIRRKTAEQVLDVYSDPAKLRELRTYKGISARSKQGIAALTRLGVFEAAGIGEDDPDFIPKVNEFFDWIDEMTVRGLENGEDEG